MNPLNHVAIIMDGNGRWGLKHKNSRNAGHKEGLITVEKIIKSVGEKSKVSIRNIRREANEDIKKLLKSKDIGEDDEKIHEKKVQIMTDDHIKSVDDKVSLKEKEIMTI